MPGRTRPEYSPWWRTRRALGAPLARRRALGSFADHQCLARLPERLSPDGFLSIPLPRPEAAM